MNRIALSLAVAGFSFSCASTHSSSYAIADADTFEAANARRVETVEVAPSPSFVLGAPTRAVEAPEAAPSVEPFESVYTSAELAIEPAPLTTAPALVNTESYTMIKGGLYEADIDEAGDGFIINAAFGRYFTSLLSAELEIGYFSASDDENGLDGDVWGIPVMLNGRASIPLWILEVYGGLGIGGIYYDAEVDIGPGLSAEDDGFVWGGNGFLGASVGIGGVAVGLEGKYYVTGDVDDVDESLDAFALMLTLGFGG